MKVATSWPISVGIERCLFTSAVSGCGSTDLSPTRGSLPAGPWITTSPADVLVDPRTTAWLESRNSLVDDPAWYAATGCHSLTWTETIPGSCGCTVAVRTHTWASSRCWADCPSIEMIDGAPSRPAACATWLEVMWRAPTTSTVRTAMRVPNHSHDRSATSTAPPTAPTPPPHGR